MSFLLSSPLFIGINKTLTRPKHLDGLIRAGIRPDFPVKKYESLQVTLIDELNNYPTIIQNIDERNIALSKIVEKTSELVPFVFAGFKSNHLIQWYLSDISNLLWHNCFLHINEEQALQLLISFSSIEDSRSGELHPGNRLRPADWQHVELSIGLWQKIENVKISSILPLLKTITRLGLLWNESVELVLNERIQQCIEIDEINGQYNLNMFGFTKESAELIIKKFKNTKVNKTPKNIALSRISDDFSIIDDIWKPKVENMISLWTRYYLETSDETITLPILANVLSLSSYNDVSINNLNKTIVNRLLNEFYETSDDIICQILKSFTNIGYRNVQFLQEIFDLMKQRLHKMTYWNLVDLGEVLLRLNVYAHEDNNILLNDIDDIQQNQPHTATEKVLGRTDLILKNIEPVRSITTKQAEYEQRISNEFSKHMSFLSFGYACKVLILLSKFGCSDSRTLRYAIRYSYMQAFTTISPTLACECIIAMSTIGTDISAVFHKTSLRKILANYLSLIQYYSDKIDNLDILADVIVAIVNIPGAPEYIGQSQFISWLAEFTLVSNREFFSDDAIITISSELYRSFQLTSINDKLKIIEKKHLQKAIANDYIDPQFAIMSKLPDNNIPNIQKKKKNVPFSLANDFVFNEAEGDETIDLTNDVVWEEYLNQSQIKPVKDSENAKPSDIRNLDKKPKFKTDTKSSISSIKNISNHTQSLGLLKGNPRFVSTICSAPIVYAIFKGKLVSKSYLKNNSIHYLLDGWNNEEMTNDIYPIGESSDSSPIWVRSIFRNDPYLSEMLDFRYFGAGSTDVLLPVSPNRSILRHYCTVREIHQLLYALSLSSKIPRSNEIIETILNIKFSDSFLHFQSTIDFQLIWSLLTVAISVNFNKLNKDKIQQGILNWLDYYFHNDLHLNIIEYHRGDYVNDVRVSPNSDEVRISEYIYEPILDTICANLVLLSNIPSLEEEERFVNFLKTFTNILIGQNVHTVSGRQLFHSIAAYLKSRVYFKNLTLNFINSEKIKNKSKLNKIGESGLFELDRSDIDFINFVENNVSIDHKHAPDIHINREGYLEDFRLFPVVIERFYPSGQVQKLLHKLNNSSVNSLTDVLHLLDENRVVDVGIAQFNRHKEYNGLYNPNYNSYLLNILNDEILRNIGVKVVWTETNKHNKHSIIYK